MENTDVIEYLTSDVVTITRRELRAYRGGDGDAERILARYSGELRDLLDAAALGPGPLAEVEAELALMAHRQTSGTPRRPRSLLWFPVVQEQRRIPRWLSPGASFLLAYG